MVDQQLHVPEDGKRLTPLRRLAVVAVTGAVALCAGRSASAFSFTPIAPATCPSFTEIPFTYNVGGGTGVWEQPRDVNDHNVYMGNVNYYRSIMGNKYTSRFGLHVATFSSQANADRLDLIVPSGTTQQLSGNPALGWYDMVAPFNEEIDSYPFRLRWVTDNSISSTGFSIDRARVCYDGSLGSTATPLLKPLERTSGVLLGTDDVVTMRATVPGIDVHTTFALWGGAGPNGADFDLFLGCNVIPTPTSYMAASRGGTTQEFLHVDSSACAPGSTIYVIVHAFQGSGTFNIVEHQHYKSEHYAVGRADTRGACPLNSSCPVTDQNQLASFRQTMELGFKRYFGATEGTQFWAGLELYNTGVASQPISFSIGRDRANADVCGSGLRMFWNDPSQGGQPDNDRVLAHELGHMRSCVGDEYNTTTNAMACGHSIMANAYDTVNNFCYCSDWLQGQSYNSNSCHLSFGDHSLDRTTGQGPDTNHGPVWTNLQNRTPVPIFTTPDNYDYADFSFNGIYSVIQR